MHINFQTYRTIKRSLAHVLHTRPDSHDEQHLNTLTLMICGSGSAQHVQFDKIASHAPIRHRKNERLITRFRRWVKHADLSPEAIWFPFARAVLAGFHLPETMHCALVRQLQDLRPAQATVTVLGAGAFDGTELQATIRATKWEYICRTASNILIYAQDRVFSVGDLPLQPGAAVFIADGRMTAKRYGPILLLGVWDAKQKEPIYRITSLADADDALERYRLRFRIACMFANHTSRGFRIDKSHLANPSRLARLLIATSLAYVWIHVAAAFAQAHGWVEQFHRTDRCDLGLFQIGLRAIQYALREGLRVPVSFRLPIGPPGAPQVANGFSVR